MFGVVDEGEMKELRMVAIEEKAQLYLARSILQVRMYLFAFSCACVCVLHFIAYH